VALPDQKGEAAMRRACEFKNGVPSFFTAALRRSGV